MEAEMIFLAIENATHLQQKQSHGKSAPMVSIAMEAARSATLYKSKS
jgi:hypothetical protein